MQTVLSHIVRKRLSSEFENVVTEALGFVLTSCEDASDNLNRILRQLKPGLPDMQFHTQMQTPEGPRPDIAGVADDGLHVIIENKFWAGLTDYQPVGYLQLLNTLPEQAILLFIVPEPRTQTIWRELTRRCKDAELALIDVDSVTGFHVAETNNGIQLAMGTWGNILGTLALGLRTEAEWRNEIEQIQSLCDEAEVDAFVPFSASFLDDYRISSYLLQINSITQEVVQRGIEKGFLSVDRLQARSSWERIGRYVLFRAAGGIGFWIGTELRLWNQEGSSPLWLVFEGCDWGRYDEVQQVLNSWVNEQCLPMRATASSYSVGLPIPPGEELPVVVDEVVRIMSIICTMLNEGLEEKSRRSNEEQ